MSKKKSEGKQTDVSTQPCDLAEIPVPADYPFGSLLCRKEHEGIFKKLFPISSESEKLKEDKHVETL